MLHTLLTQLTGKALLAEQELDKVDAIELGCLEEAAVSLLDAPGRLSICQFIEEIH